MRNVVDPVELEVRRLRRDLRRVVRKYGAGLCLDDRAALALWMADGVFSEIASASGVRLSCVVTGELERSGD